MVHNWNLTGVRNKNHDRLRVVLKRNKTNMKTTIPVKESTTICNARTQDGKYCGQEAGWATTHTGIGRCKHHGGASKGRPKGNAAQTKLKKMQKLAVRLNPKIASKFWTKVKYRYNIYKKSAIDRDIEWNLKMGEFVVFWNADCYYCGEHIEGIGLDRVDNTEGYKMDNVVPCCATCNRMKMSKTHDSYILKCVKIALKHGFNIPTKAIKPNKE